MDTICGQDGLFGYVGHSSNFLEQASKFQERTPPIAPPASFDDALPSITELQQLYKNKLADPQVVINSVFDRIEKYQKIDPAVWISIESREKVLEAAKALSEKYAGKPLPPLFGIPFALKDNIDIKGVRTTAACEAYAYMAESTAPAVQLLLDAGALYIGKLNMDQLATGLSGCRSPYGTPHSVYSAEHISGGSSSGTGVSVAAGLVSFALGTDTAGSGRVPAAFNGIVGYKPTKGTISARGVVPACKSLDTLSIMTPTLADARQVWYIIDQHDPLDPYAKPPQSLSLWTIDYRGPLTSGFRFAIPPPSALSICSPAYLSLFSAAVQKLRSLGGILVEDIDYAPFEQAANLLYDASLVHERIACIGASFLSSHLPSLHPTTRALFSTALSAHVPAWQVFHDQAIQASCTRLAQNTFRDRIDVLVLPTTPCHPTISEMQAEPLKLNAHIGTFTHAANVVDLCAVSVNAGWVQEEQDRGKLPFGVSFLGASGMDAKILSIAGVFEDMVREEGR
jgi:allophanate hydrolase